MSAHYRKAHPAKMKARKPRVQKSNFYTVAREGGADQTQFGFVADLVARMTKTDKKRILEFTNAMLAVSD